MYAGAGRTVVGIWNVTELASEGVLSLLKLGVLLERADDAMPAVSDSVCLCMAQEGVYSMYAGIQIRKISPTAGNIEESDPGVVTLQLERNE
jgi:hypothetical protein